LKNNTITLFVPGLWALLGHAGNEMQASMPSLNLLLKRCDGSTESVVESEILLLNRLGWQADEGADVPVAALERLATGIDSDGFWFRADPVNLQEDQNYLMMSFPSALDLDAAEVKALSDSINEHFAEDGWRLEVVDQQRWYLGLDKNPDIQTTPLWRVVGRDVFNLMPVGNNSRQWHAWMMEMQMLLYNHTANQARIGQGKATVSGLWVWGGGELPLLQRSDILLRGDSLFMQGISRHSGCRIKALPANMSSICDDNGAQAEQLVVLEQARAALLTGDMNRGMKALHELEKVVFQPLLALLQSRKLTALSIIATPGHIVNVSAHGIRKWWRRNHIL
jgi:hypothetical protein